MFAKNVQIRKPLNIEIMSDKEMRELDAWIWQNVMLAKLVIRPADSTYPKLKYLRFPNGDEILERMWSPTTDPAAAMDVLKKCGQSAVVTITTNPSIASHLGVWTCADEQIFCTGETLELAICLFAKKLFTTKDQTI